MTVISHALMPLRVDISLLQKEVALLLQSPWLPHYNTAHYSGSWDVLPLRSAGGSTSQAYAELMGEDKYQDTPSLAHSEYLQQLINSIQTEKMSIRLLNLKVGAVIKPHRDNELCFEQGEARIHIPVFTNCYVQFKLDEQSLQMKEGSCWYINANLTHSLQNRGLTNRIHLVIDCKVNDWFRQWMELDECYRIIKEVVEDKVQKAMIIAELYRQNTEASFTIARQLQEGI